MKRSLVAVAVILLVVHQVGANDTTFTPVSPRADGRCYWSDAGNWSNGVPGQEDNATIEGAIGGGGHCYVDSNATAKYVNWTSGLMGQVGGTLVIETNFDSSANDFYYVQGGTLQVGGAVQTFVLMGGGTATAATFLNGVGGGPGPGGSLQAAAGGTDIYGGVAGRVNIEVAAGRSLNVHGTLQSGGTYNVAGTLYADTLKPFGCTLTGNGTYQIGTLDGNQGATLAVSGATVDFPVVTGYPSIVATSGLPTLITIPGGIVGSVSVGNSARVVLSGDASNDFYDWHLSGNGKLDIGGAARRVGYQQPDALSTLANFVLTGAHVVNGIAQWDGPGIVSSAAREQVLSNPTDPRLGVVAYAGLQSNPENSDAVWLYAAPFVLGDADMSGRVDFADFLIWKNAFSQNLAGGNLGGWWNAQFDYGATQTMFADFLTWKHNFGLTVADVSPLHAVPIPEPSTGVLAILAGGIVWWARRRRQR